MSTASNSDFQHFSTTFAPIECHLDGDQLSLGVLDPSKLALHQEKVWGFEVTVKDALAVDVLEGLAQKVQIHKESAAPAKCPKMVSSSEYVSATSKTSIRCSKRCAKREVSLYCFPLLAIIYIWMLIYSQISTCIHISHDTLQVGRCSWHRNLPARSAQSSAWFAARECVASACACPASNSILVARLSEIFWHWDIQGCHTKIIWASTTVCTTYRIVILWYIVMFKWFGSQEVVVPFTTQSNKRSELSGLLGTAVFIAPIKVQAVYASNDVQSKCI